MLGWVGWLVLATGLTASLLVPPPAPGEVSSTVVVGTLGALFATLLGRLVTAAVVWPSRRPALLSLAAGVLLWAAGSATLNTSGQPTVIEFPAPGEWLFLLAYAGLAAYFLLDLSSRNRATAGTWLEMTVLCGAAAALAGVLLVTPLAPQFGRQGVPLLVALLFPLLDIVLVIVVAAQVLLRKRPVSRVTVASLVGLGLLLTADTSLVTALSAGTYTYGLLLDLAWCGGFLSIVGAASRPPEPWGETALIRRFSGYGVVVAAWAAVVVLVFQPDGDARPYVVIPALVTLAAAGARMVMALREAHGAAEAFRLSRTDDLTGLPNRRAVVARLEEDLAEHRASALLLLDLDGFKEINDSLGHAAGDSMLRTVATRIRFTLPGKGLVARLGGDEFAIVLDSDDEVGLLETAHHIRDMVRKPVRVDGLELTISGSIGITTRTANDRDAGDFLRRADVAMYRAKSGRLGALIYDADRDEFSRQRLRIASDLREGIPAGQLEVWYQPQIDALTARLCGAEALVRWRHPVDGLVSPGAFLPAARRAGLMSALSEAVIRTVVADARRWQRQGHTFPVAINIAPPELLSGPVLARLYHETASAGLADDSVIVEVTEDSFITEPARAREVIEDIRRHRLQVSIDDYGTGFSSLAYLRDLPVQELKIDRSFICALLEDERSRMIVATTNQMAHGLDLRTVAEGVEDRETAQELVSLGFDVLQGYHFARPMPAAEFGRWVAEWAARASAPTSS
jgi:diguanylate cyclase (GGDEF)-like protein